MYLAKMTIGGRAVLGTSTFNVLNPATGEIINKPRGKTHD